MIIVKLSSFEFYPQNLSQISLQLEFPSDIFSIMRNTRNKRRLAEIQDNFEENNSRGSSRERSQGDLNENYITQVSQEIEGRIAKKLSQEFAKRESRILGALAKLDDFLCKPQDTKSASTPKQK